MRKSLAQMKKDCRDINEFILPRVVQLDDDKTYFPNSSFGDKCADNITKKIDSKKGIFWG
jgi:hypothetical protein